MNKLIILSGVPGSGKSTFAAQYVKSNKDAIIVGRDKLRELLFGYTEENVQSYYSHELFKEREDTISAFQKSAIQLGLSIGKTVLIDDTNCNYTRLKRLYDQYEPFGVEVRFFDTPLSECIERNNQRVRRVSDETIISFYDRFLLTKSEWEATEPAEQAVLDEVGFVFLSPNGDIPYLIRMWDGLPWLFYWHSSSMRWVSARKVTQVEVWMAFTTKMSDQDADHYHNLSERPF